MNVPSFYLRNMLLQYDRQLVAARRLDRLKRGNPFGKLSSQAKAREQGVSNHSPDEDQAEKKRRLMVEHIARELLENLLFAGSENPVVEEVRQELDHELGGRYTYKYPPGSFDVQIIREGPVQNGSQTDSAVERRELSPDEKNEVLERLWAITLAKVDATML